MTRYRDLVGSDQIEFASPNVRFAVFFADFTCLDDDGEDGVGTRRILGFRLRLANEVGAG